MADAKKNQLQIIYSKNYMEEASLENKYKKEVKNSERAITIRVTEEEFCDITIKSKAAGMSKTEFIKQAVKNSDIKFVDSEIVSKIVELDEKVNQLSCKEREAARAEVNSIKNEIFAGLLEG